MAGPEQKAEARKQGRHDGGQPVVASGNARVQETGDRVDRKGPHDGDIDKNLDPSGGVTSLRAASSVTQPMTRFRSR